MPKQATAEQKYWNGMKGFPILYEDDRRRVYKNPPPLNEIFVEDIQSGVVMRISSRCDHEAGLEFHATGGIVESFPRMENTIGWRVTPRR